MKSHCLQAAILSTAAILLLHSNSTPANADQVRYAWSGNLVPTGTEDPWQLCILGKPFTIDIRVSRDAPDLFDQNVEFAAHIVDSVQLHVDGQPVQYVDEGTVDFTDSQIHPYDFLVFTGNFERFGHTIEIGTNLALPLNTFHFTQILEPPPWFSSLANAARSAMGPQGPYAGIVPAGTPILVVPSQTQSHCVQLSA